MGNYIKIRWINIQTDEEQLYMVVLRGGRYPKVFKLKSTLWGIKKPRISRAKKWGEFIQSVTVVDLLGTNPPPLPSRRWYIAW